MNNSDKKVHRRTKASAGKHGAPVANNDEFNKYSRNAGNYGSGHQRSNRASAQGNFPTQVNYSGNNQSFNQYSRNNGGYGSGYQPQHNFQHAGYSAQGNMDEMRLQRLREQQLAQKKARRKKGGLIALLIVLVLCLGGAGTAFAYMVHINSNMQENVDEDLLKSLTVTDSPSDPFYMLLLGVDKSEDREESNVYGGAYRSDSMILARIDPKNKCATMVSIPRDTKVTIPGHGTQKINAGYAYGGPSGAIKAVESVCDVKISHYAEIDFNGFAEVVDALGGVEVDVAMEINDKYTGHIDAGRQVLDGDQALILCRSRHAYDKYATDGDVIRSAYQRTVISACVKKLMSSDIITISNTISKVSEYVTTDFDISSIIGLARNMMGIDVDKHVYTASLPTTPSFENEIWYEIIDTAAWKKMMDRVVQGLPPTEEDTVDAATGVKTSNSGSGDADAATGATSSSMNMKGTTCSIRNGCGKSGVASEAADKIKSTGIDIDTGNADSANYDKTLIFYEDDGMKARAEEIARLLGKGTAQKNPGNYILTSDILIVIGKDW